MKMEAGCSSEMLVSSILLHDVTTQKKIIWAKVLFQQHNSAKYRIATETVKRFMGWVYIKISIYVTLIIL
jgi:hypothetical protein